METHKFSDGYLSRQKAQRYSSLSLRALDYARERGELQAFKVGRRVLIRKQDLDLFIEQRRAGPDLDKLVTETLRELRAGK